MDRQVIPAYLLEKVYSVMNFLHCFSKDLGIEEYLTADEFYVALEEMSQERRCEVLINNIAGSFVNAIIIDIRNRNKHRDYMAYEYKQDVMKQLRQCLKKQGSILSVAADNWREFLGFFYLVTPFQKTYLVPDFDALQSSRNRNDDSDGSSNPAEDEEEQEGDEEENNQIKDEDEEEIIADQQRMESATESLSHSDKIQMEAEENKDDEDEEGGNKGLKRTDSSRTKVSRLYQSYTCESITDVEFAFEGFSTEKKLEAFLILVRIAYKLPFTSAFMSNRFKQSKEKDPSLDVKGLKKCLEEERQNLLKIESEKNTSDTKLGTLLASITDDSNAMSEELLKEIKKEKTVQRDIAIRFDRSLNATDRIEGQIRTAIQRNAFAVSNWVIVGVDRHGNQYLITVLDQSLVFRKTMEVESVSSEMLEETTTSFKMVQFDCMVSIREELNITVQADDEIWTKLNEFVKDGVLTLPEVHASTPEEDEFLKQQKALAESGQRRSGIETVGKFKYSEIRKNLLTRKFWFQLDNGARNYGNNSRPNQSKASADWELKKLNMYAYSNQASKKLSAESYGFKNNKKKLVVEDSDEDEF